MKESEIFNHIQPILTFDTDWAPDYVIDYVSKKLEKLKIKATWYITHDSPAIRRLQNNALFEIGLHPNFHINSSQGKGVDEILKNLKKIAPDAKSIRTHGLLQSSEILLKFNKYGIENDVSILLSGEPFLKPHYSKYLKIIRIPYYWEDDIHMIEGDEWEDVKKYFFISGLKIFDFHPIHIFLNSNGMEKYNELKLNGYPKIDKKLLLKYRNKFAGTNMFFENLIKNLNKRKTHTINDISQVFNNLRNK